MTSVKCPCDDPECRAEIISEGDALLIRMNDCAAIRNGQPEFRFLLNPNTMVALIHLLRQTLLKSTEQELL